MKKVIISFLCVSLIFTLVSCNNKKAKEAKEEVNEETTKEVIKQEVVEEVKPEESIVVEETEEDTSTSKVIKVEENTQDIEDMFFWVVFYDQYGYELQREALKYGTIPEYKEWLPEGFDNWIYKRSGIKVDEFVPIVGNTYFQAQCHEVHHESSGSQDSPSPSPSVTYTTIWEGSEQLSLWSNIMGESTYDWSTAQPGITVRVEFTCEASTVNGYSVRYVNSWWTTLPSTVGEPGGNPALDGNYFFTSSDTYHEHVLTQDDIDTIIMTGEGLKLIGNDVTVTAIKIKN